MSSSAPSIEDERVLCLVGLGSTAERHRVDEWGDRPAFPHTAALYAALRATLHTYVRATVGAIGRIQGGRDAYADTGNSCSGCVA
jgi:hypothetical protein